MTATKRCRCGRYDKTDALFALVLLAVLASIALLIWTVFG